MFTKGKEYKRTDLHSQFGGQMQGGISTPKDYNFILLFTSPNGKQHGYQDNWKDNFYYYSGEGQNGDMEFRGGNRAIRDHIIDGKELHLFKSTRKAFVEYVGQFVCANYHYTEETGRKTIIFELLPEDIAATEVLGEQEQEDIQQELDRWPQEKLREKAIAATVSSRESKVVKRDYYYRSEAIKKYARARANGVCEGCSKQAPFETDKSEPYLEVHHIRRLADEGPDDPHWVVAICANCHRRAHYSKDAKPFNKSLEQVAQLKEAEAENRPQMAGMRR